ncbi:hypothetical protein ACLB2K_022560 [Fragaria x ananassa]
MVTLRPRQGSNNKKQGSSVSETTGTPRSRQGSQNKKQDSKKRSSSTNESGLPVGLRFNPTDHELVDYYLQSRIALGDSFHSDFVSECPNFYGENEPWVVWQMYGGGESKKEENKTLYFFTHRKRLSPTSTRFDRKVGSGTWSGQYPRDVFDEEDGSVVIGIKREFRYEEGCDDRHNKAWLMQEYQIVDDDSDIVLCALRKNHRTPQPAQSSSVVGKTRVDVKKRKTIVDKPKAKRHKKKEIFDEEEDGSSVDDLSMEPQGTSVDIDQPKMEQINFELDQDHPMLQVVSPFGQLHDDQDCYYPELLVDDNPDTSTIDDLLAQTPTCYDNNNFNLVSGGSVQDESDKFLDLLLYS